MATLLVIVRNAAMRNSRHGDLRTLMTIGIIFTPLAHAVTRCNLPLEHDEVCISSGRAYGLLLFNRSSKAFVKNTELSSRGRRRQRRQNNKTQDFSQYTSITEMNAVKVNRCLLPFTLWRFPIHLPTCVHRHSAINSKLQPSFFRQVYLRVRTMETAITDMRRTFFCNFLHDPHEQVYQVFLVGELV